MVIVDTTVWIDFFGGVDNPHTSWLRRAAGVEPLGLTDLIVCEILQGIRHGSEFLRIERGLQAFFIFETGGTALAVASARNYRSLRQRGYTVRTTIDCLIATFCLEFGHELLHRDQDYDPLEACLQLRVIRP